VVSSRRAVGNSSSIAALEQLGGRKYTGDNWVIESDKNCCRDVALKHQQVHSSGDTWITICITLV